MIRKAGEPVRLALTCTIADAALLWDAAADRAARDSDMPHDDVIDTIGPREDPEIEACVSLLFDTLVRPGGAFASIEITSLQTTADAVPAAVRATMIGSPTPLRAPCAA